MQRNVGAFTRALRGFIAAACLAALAAGASAQPVQKPLRIIVPYGTWGPASTPGLYRQWIDRSAGVQLTSVPYKGVGAGTLQAMLSGEIDASLFTIGQILPYIRDGKVKPIAIVGDKRWGGLPNVPA